MIVGPLHLKIIEFLYLNEMEISWSIHFFYKIKRLKQFKTSLMWGFVSLIGSMRYDSQDA